MSIDIMSPGESNQPFVYISYARKNADASYSQQNADELRGVLERMTELNIRFWTDNSFEPGIRWKNENDRMVAGCHVLIAFLSKEYCSSKNCWQELEDAKNTSRIIIAYYLDGFSRDDLRQYPKYFELLDPYQQIEGDKLLIGLTKFEQLMRNTRVLACVRQPETPPAPAAPSAPEKSKEIPGQNGSYHTADDNQTDYLRSKEPSAARAAQAQEPPLTAAQRFRLWATLLIAGAYVILTVLLFTVRPFRSMLNIQGKLGGVFLVTFGYIVFVMILSYATEIRRIRRRLNPLPAPVSQKARRAHLIEIYTMPLILQLTLFFTVPLLSQPAEKILSYIQVNQTYPESGHEWWPLAERIYTGQGIMETFIICVFALLFGVILIMKCGTNDEYWDHCTRSMIFSGLLCDLIGGVLVRKWYQLSGDDLLYWVRNTDGFPIGEGDLTLTYQLINGRVFNAPMCYGFLIAALLLPVHAWYFRHMVRKPKASHKPAADEDAATWLALDIGCTVIVFVATLFLFIY